MRLAVRHAGRAACLIVLGVPPEAPASAIWAALSSVVCPAAQSHHPGICSIIAEPPAEWRGPLGLDEVCIVFWNDIHRPDRQVPASATPPAGASVTV